MNANPDPEQVRTIVAFLTPFLPYLIAGAKEAGKGLSAKVGELAGEGAWKKAQVAWKKLSDRLSPKQKAKAGVIAVDPTDQQEVVSFARTLIDTLQNQPELTAELSALVGQGETVQKIIARNQSLIAQVVQKGPGTKTMEAIDNSTIIDARQE